MLGFFKKKTLDTFQISIGEEGAVVIYIKDGAIKNKLFVKSIADNDSNKFKQLLLSDPNAYIEIYIDTLDQSYVQRSIPAVGSFAVSSIAKSRLEREVPKDNLKSLVQISRAESGRKDWVYTFISVPYEEPISSWVEFLLPYNNILKGIYFFPIEIYAIIQKLESFKPKALLEIGRSKKSEWDVVITQNKSGGFRQVAFLNGKIIFSRLLNNISDPIAEVIAGNIEQEITNSLEYLTRLSLGYEESINVYTILSEDVNKYIRTDKIKATNFFQYTPYSLAEKLELKNVATVSDKFTDPVI
jgi:hypothetical protein